MTGQDARSHEGDPSPGGYVAVCLEGDIRNGQQRRFAVAGRDILLVGAGGRVFALANRCPHMAKPLDGGRVTGMSFTCPVHAAQFDLETGRSIGFPKTGPLQRFDVRIENGRIFVGVERNGPD
ncbi:Rieske (2Fe-2S) protein [Sphingobium sp. AN641]|uniref:Rieske (2Fe-2S) protein n=1 Tax=Sphingobium sp. AN641 TaxID=3133443 RepID=UPI0030BAD661